MTVQQTTELVYETDQCARSLTQMAVTARQYVRSACKRSTAVGLGAAWDALVEIETARTVDAVIEAAREADRRLAAAAEPDDELARRAVREARQILAFVGGDW